MPDETKETENTPESAPAEKPVVEPEVIEPVPEPVVVETAPNPEETKTEIVPETEQTEVENVPDTTPEIPLETTGEALTKPVEVAPEPETPQMGGNEPLAETPPLPTTDKDAEATAEEPEEPAPTPVKEEPRPQRQERKTIETTTKPEPDIKERLGLLRKMARATIQLRREKKLMKIMELFASQTAVTNDEVEKLLHVSDATATRYLSELEKRGKLTQVGTTGRGVSYIKR